jgi:hypothetical protein
MVYVDIIEHSTVEESLKWLRKNACAREGKRVL